MAPSQKNQTFLGKMGPRIFVSEYHLPEDQQQIPKTRSRRVHGTIVYLPIHERLIFMVNVYKLSRYRYTSPMDPMGTRFPYQLVIGSKKHSFLSGDLVLPRVVSWNPNMQELKRLIYCFGWMIPRCFSKSIRNQRSFQQKESVLGSNAGSQSNIMWWFQRVLVFTAKTGEDHLVEKKHQMGCDEAPTSTSASYVVSWGYLCLLLPPS